MMTSQQSKRRQRAIGAVLVSFALGIGLIQNRNSHSLLESIEDPNQSQLTGMPPTSKSENDLLTENDQEESVVIPTTTRRRRLEGTRRRTLAPGAQATIRMAHEMALAKAREQGHYSYEVSVEPFQAMKDRYQMRQSNKQETATEVMRHPKEKLFQLRKSVRWEEIDPLNTTSLKRIQHLPRLKNDLVDPKVEYLGVTVDAGRFYFDLEWFKKLIIYLHKLCFNLIVVRLTDDENFRVMLHSHPQLAFSTDAQRRTYSPQDLKYLVSFAKEQYNITMIPEINLPLRAASWAGIPGMIVPCPNFVCTVGHYIPLNVHHKEFPIVLRDVIQEIISIFEYPPLLHLGGSMSIMDSNGCFEEAGIDLEPNSGVMEYWETFESILQSVLRELAYPEEQVVRSEASEFTEFYRNEEHGNGDSPGIQLPGIRVGGVQHYWFTMPQKQQASTTNKSGRMDEYIVSTGVDFAVDTEDTAWDVYLNTLEAVRLPKSPKAIVVGTLYLNPELWMQRNVLSRLIAVAMGASHEAAEDALSATTFPDSFMNACTTLFPGKGHTRTICTLHGMPTVSDRLFLEAQMLRNQDWKKAACNRLATASDDRVFKPYTPDRHFADSKSNIIFWDKFHRKPVPYTPNQEGKKGKPLAPEVLALKHRTEKSGIILDFANSLPVSMPQFLILFLDFIAPLGLDLLQIRLVDDFAFAANFEFNAMLSQSFVAEEQATQIPKLTAFHQIIDAAARVNMAVFPEISVSTNAGGWINAGYLVQCPKQYCSSGTDISNDIREPLFLATLYSVIRELREVFGYCPFLHLGYDERAESMSCFEETGSMKSTEYPPFSEFEAKLQKLLRMLGYQPENVIRWDNVEQLTYDDRAGGITQYRAPLDDFDLVDVREGEPFIHTISLLETTAASTVYSIYQLARKQSIQRPLAIMAEIRSLDRQVWLEHHMALRVLAFKMGISENIEAEEADEGLDHARFIEKIIDLCKAVKFSVYRDDADCRRAEAYLRAQAEQGDDDANVKDSLERYPIAGFKYRQEVCEKYTRPTRTMAMKDKFLVGESEKQYA